MALHLCGKRLLLTRNFTTSAIKRNGYVVLVPEIGDNLPDKNPLLQPNGLPEFTNFTIEKCMAAIAKQTIDFEKCIQNIEQNIKQNDSKHIFKNVFEPIEEKGVQLDMTWGLSKTLYLANNGQMPTKNYLAIHDRAKRARVTKYNNLMIYKHAKRALDNERNDWTDEEKRILNKFILEGRLNGLDLTPVMKTQLDTHLKKLRTEKSNFHNKTDISTHLFSHTITDSNLASNFPTRVLKESAVDSHNYLEGPWKIMLQPRIYLPVMENCPDREVNWNIWQALVTRGSGYGNKEYATGVHVEEIRFLRREIAKLIGFQTFADMSMETKMAGNVSNVKNFLNTLLERAKPVQDRELDNLYEFATERGFNDKNLELWDIPFWRKRQRLELFNYREEDYKQYFTLPTVLNGLFYLSERLFGVVIRQRTGVSTWHKNVKFYDIYDTKQSKPIAGFYLDLYSKTDERVRFIDNNGWMVGIRNQSLITETKPLSALIFTFDAPTNGRPCCLSFNEVKSLFHKFGHSLQHLLSQTNYSEVSGTSNIEWDAVEVSGHLFTHFLYNRNIIESITSHCDSGEKLPAQMFQSLLDVHKHLAGTELCRELYLAALDLELHSTNDYWLDIVRKLWPKYRNFSLKKIDSHVCSFSKIFTEDWAAAYYCNLWSRMIAADVYSAFDEVQDNNEQITAVGKRFRETFLTLGGSCHPGKTFRKFRGRDPSPKALLSSLGLKELKEEDHVRNFI